MPYLNVSLEEAKGCVGKGWHLLLEALYHVKPEDVPVLQVKEKFGGLRFYTKGEPLWYRTLINAVENTSLSYCERCGRVVYPDDWKKANSQGGWILTLCPTCATLRDEARAAGKRFDVNREGEE